MSDHDEWDWDENDASSVPIPSKHHAPVSSQLITPTISKNVSKSIAFTRGVNEVVDEWEWDEVSSGTSNDRVAVIRKSLRDFQLNLADEFILEGLNEELARVSFGDFISYYRAGGSKARRLEELTLLSDLHRMQYSVLLGGQQTSDKEIIAAHYQETKHTAAGELWGLANQSIYSGILLCMQDLFVKPELGITLKNTQSEFMLDLDSSLLQSHSDFVLGCGGDSEAIELARFRADVEVSISTRGDGGGHVHQLIARPRLANIFDDDLLRVAQGIARAAGPEREAQEDMERRPRVLGRLGDVRSVVAQASVSVATGIIRGVGSIVGADKPVSFRELAQEAAREQQRPQESEPELRADPGSPELPIPIPTLFRGWGASLLSGLGSVLAGVTDDEPLQLYRREPAKSYHSGAQAAAESNASVATGTGDGSEVCVLGSDDVVVVDISSFLGPDAESEGTKAVEELEAEAAPPAVVAPAVELRGGPEASEFVETAAQLPANDSNSASDPVIPLRVRPTRNRSKRAA